MSSLELERLVSAYRARGVLLDANLLVLYIVGSHDPRLIGSVKATRSFTVRDYEFVAGLVSLFDRLVTTPHVLTEVDGLSNVGLPGRHRWDYLDTFRQRIEEAVEVQTPARDVVADPAFLRLGLTDAAVLTLGEGGPLVVSTDLDLCIALESRGLGVVNYNHIRLAI